MSESEVRQTLCEGRFLRLMKCGTWEYAERTRISGIVGIVAVTGDEKLVLVEQNRVPVGENCIELPAGLAGDVPGTEGEDLRDAAHRELLEETGYSASDMTFLCEGPPSAGTTSEMIQLYLAQGLRKTADGGGDHSEEITVHEVAISEVPAWLEGQRSCGKLIDLRIYTALFFLTQRRD